MFFSTDDLKNKPDDFLNSELINSKYVKFVNKDFRFRTDNGKEIKENFLCIAVGRHSFEFLYKDEDKRDAAFEEIKKLLKESNK